MDLASGYSSVPIGVFCVIFTGNAVGSSTRRRFLPHSLVEISKHPLCIYSSRGCVFINFKDGGQGFVVNQAFWGRGYVVSLHHSQPLYVRSRCIFHRVAYFLRTQREGSRRFGSKFIFNTKDELRILLALVKMDVNLVHFPLLYPGIAPFPSPPPIHGV